MYSKHFFFLQEYLSTTYYEATETIFPGRLTDGELYRVL